MSKRKPHMSYSAATKYKTCPQLYDFSYVQRVRPKEQGASLDFGSSVDTCLNFLLQAKKDGNETLGLASFKDVFLNDPKKGWNLAFDNPKLRYRAADFDADVLWLDDDKTLITKWEDESKIKQVDALKAEKQKDFKPFGGNNLKMFNRLCWLSLKRKGLLMLEAFVLEILPKIKKVISLQQKIEGEIGDVAEASGYIDLICEYEGYNKPIVFDIKTSGSFYDKDSVLFSEQLHLYLAVVSAELQTQLAGFIVLLKFMKKKEVCIKCQYIKDGRHHKCNAEVAGERCNGEWGSIPEGHTQVIVNEISNEKLDEALRSFTNVAVHATQGLPFKNYARCFDYGLCDYFYLCHYGDKSKYNFPKEQEVKELVTLPVLNNVKGDDNEPK